jgi:hypothetical protein
MTVWCPQCSHPLQPSGRCERCGCRDAPHSGTWGRYYADVERFNQRSNLPWLALAACVAVIVVLWVWTL